MFLQFSDAGKTEVIGCSALAQDSECFPYSEEVEASDPRYLAWLETLPEAARANMPRETDRLPAPSA